MSSVGRQLDRQGYSPHSIACVVIAGLRPTDEEQSKGFEQYRHSLQGVHVVTFDGTGREAEGLARIARRRPGFATGGEWPGCHLTSCKCRLDVAVEIEARSMTERFRTTLKLPLEERMSLHRAIDLHLWIPLCGYTLYEGVSRTPSVPHWKSRHTST